jgi:hypothetical protein
VVGGDAVAGQGLRELVAEVVQHLLDDGGRARGGDPEAVDLLAGLVERGERLVQLGTAAMDDAHLVAEVTKGGDLLGHRTQLVGVLDHVPAELEDDAHGSWAVHGSRRVGGIEGDVLFGEVASPGFGRVRP